MMEFKSITEVVSFLVGFAIATIAFFFIGMTVKKCTSNPVEPVDTIRTEYVADTVLQNV